MANNKNISTTTWPNRWPNGTAKAGQLFTGEDKTIANATALGLTSVRQVKCCNDDGTLDGGGNCSDHDPDAIKVREIRDKSLKSTLTALEIADHNACEIRCKAKGIQI